MRTRAIGALDAEDEKHALDVESVVAVARRAAVARRHQILHRRDRKSVV